MCGISGAVLKTNKYNAEVISKAVDKLYHRGNDHIGIGVERNVVFGHNRLSIIDLSENGNQPKTDGAASVCFNGEIYNYKSLGNYGNDVDCALLHPRSRGFEAALNDFHGMFAISYLHGDNLYLAVDRMGEKPLYYYEDADIFIWASSISAILPIKNDWQLDTDGLNSFWALGATMGERAVYNGIKRLCGAYMIRYNVATNQITKKRWWTPAPFGGNIQDRIYNAIDLTKVSDVPVYVLLSGGVDSTIVASRSKGGNAIHLESPEKRYAQQAASKHGLKLHDVSAHSDYLEDMTDFVDKTGEPNMAALIPYITCRGISMFGRVAITANGADELFCGYDRHVWDEKKWLGHLFRQGYEPFLEEIKSLYPIPNGLDGRRWLELMTYVQFDLNRTLDSASMAHSVEVRSPFLNHELVQTALSIPVKQHIGKLGGKQILKEMLLKQGFRQDFVKRAKLGFSLHKPLPDFTRLQEECFQNCIKEGLYTQDPPKDGRGLSYTKTAAIAMWLFYKKHFL